MKMSFPRHEASADPSLMPLVPRPTVIVRSGIAFVGSLSAPGRSVSPRGRPGSPGGGRVDALLRRGFVMVRSVDCFGHFVHALVERDTSVESSRDSRQRAGTFHDGLASSSDPPGETFRCFDPDFRWRDDSSGTDVSNNGTRVRAVRTGVLAIRSRLNFHAIGA
jgi:hypothetical protein